MASISLFLDSAVQVTGNVYEAARKVLRNNLATRLVKAQLAKTFGLFVGIPLDDSEKTAYVQSIWETATYDFTKKELEDLGMDVPEGASVSDFVMLQYKRFAKKDGGNGAEMDEQRKTWLNGLLKQCFHDKVLITSVVSKNYLGRVIKMFAKSGIDFRHILMANPNVIMKAVGKSRDFCAGLLFLVIRHGTLKNNCGLVVNILTSLLWHALSFRSESESFLDECFQDACQTIINDWESHSRKASMSFMDKIKESKTLSQPIDKDKVINRLSRLMDEHKEQFSPVFLEEFRRTMELFKFATLEDIIVNRNEFISFFTDWDREWGAQGRLDRIGHEVVRQARRSFKSKIIEDVSEKQKRLSEEAMEENPPNQKKVTPKGGSGRPKGSDLAGARKLPEFDFV